jgi:hypothetical protein
MKFQGVEVAAEDIIVIVLTLAMGYLLVIDELPPRDYLELYEAVLGFYLAKNFLFRLLKR